MLLEHGNIISFLFENSEERGKERKEIGPPQWTVWNDGFKILVDLLHALVLCSDSDTSPGWIDYACVGFCAL